MNEVFLRVILSIVATILCLVCTAISVSTGVEEVRDRQIPVVGLSFLALALIAFAMLYIMATGQVPIDEFIG